MNTRPLHNLPKIVRVTRLNRVVRNQHSNQSFLSNNLFPSRSNLLMRFIWDAFGQMTLEPFCGQTLETGIHCIGGGS